MVDLAQDRGSSLLKSTTLGIVYALFLARVVLAFSVAAAARSRWLPSVLPTGVAVFWLIATLRMAAESDTGTGEDQTGVAVYAGVVAVGVLAAAAGAGRALRLWLDERL
jgi:hypothetical protein